MERKEIEKNKNNIIRDVFLFERRNVSPCYESHEINYLGIKII